jgi:hypothetical protein
MQSERLGALLPEKLQQFSFLRWDSLFRLV